jgi:glycosyltransferase involved in cell wall biosynthesis
MTPLPQLHLLWLTEHYYPGQGGMARSCDRLVQSLRALGVCIDVIHFTPRASAWTFEHKHQGRYLACPLDDDVPHALQRLWNILTTDPALQTLTHVVAFGGFVPLLAAPTYAAWLNVPLVTLLRGNDFDLGLFTPGRRATLCEALERAARVCLMSRDHVARIRALVPQAHTVCIPGGIDLETWHPLPSEQQAAAAWRHHTVAPERLVLGLFGTMKKKKGGLFLLQALRDAGCAQRVHLLCIGTFEEAMMRC